MSILAVPGSTAPPNAGTLWRSEISGARARPMTLDAMREVAMPGGEVPLLPGELYFGRAPARLSTLLGACVSVTVWHRASRSGGICHYLMPMRAARGARLDGRFGDEALELLAATAAAGGLTLADCEIKVFGGGGILTSTDGPPALRIGENNVACARQWAARQGTTISAEHVGGEGYRRITFDLERGSVDVCYTPSVSLAWAGAATRQFR